jgi:hypothetical protein
MDNKRIQEIISLANDITIFIPTDGVLSQEKVESLFD